MAKIKQFALPAFEAWSEPIMIQKAVFRMTEVDRPDWLVDIALWAGSRTAAEDLITGYLKAHSADIPAFIGEVARLREHGASELRRHDMIGDLVRLAAFHDLDLRP